MSNEILITRWLNTFPELAELEPEAQGELLGATQFNRLRQGDIAYRQGQAVTSANNGVVKGTAGNIHVAAKHFIEE